MEESLSKQQEISSIKTISHYVLDIRMFDLSASSKTDWRNEACLFCSYITHRFTNDDLLHIKLQYLKPSTRPFNTVIHDTQVKKSWKTKYA